MNEILLNKIAHMIQQKLQPDLAAAPSNQTYAPNYEYISIKYKIGYDVQKVVDTYIDEYYHNFLKYRGCEEAACPYLKPVPVTRSTCSSCPIYEHPARDEICRWLVDNIKKYIEDYYKNVRNRCFYRFYPVGQGLMCGIYTCRYVYRGIVIDMNAGIFDVRCEISYCDLMLYDCGSTTNTKFSEERAKAAFPLLKSDCERFKVHKESGKYVINQLFISHFDYDHINGIPKLSEEYIIKNIIYPFSNILDKMFQLLKNMDAVKDSNGLLEPKEYLMLNSNVEKIIEVHPGKDLDYGVMSRLSDNTDIRGAAGALIYDPADEINNSNGASAFYKAYMPEGVDCDGNRISVSKDDGIWMQQLIFCLPSSKTYEEAYDVVRKGFSDKLGIDFTESTQNIINQIIGRLRVNDFHEIIVGIFNDIGYDAASNPNVSSLCLYFGPKSPVKKSNEDISTRKIKIASCEINEIQKSLKQKGLLLTGDSVLFYGKDVSKAGSVSHAKTLVDEMNKSNACPGAILLPHHGSEHNIDKESFDILYGGTGAETGIVSFGKNYKFGHPHAIPCKLFGQHIFPVVQEENIKGKEKRFLPPEKDLVNYTTPCPPGWPGGEPVINNVKLFHCNEECCVLLESYNTL